MPTTITSPDLLNAIQDAQTAARQHQTKQSDYRRSASRNPVSVSISGRLATVGSIFWCWTYRKP